MVVDMNKKLMWICTINSNTLVWCADSPLGTFCINLNNDSYFYTLLGKMGRNHWEPADSMEDAKNKCQDTVDDIIVKVLEYLGLDDVVDKPEGVKDSEPTENGPWEEWE